jgi:hypothetical protein
MPRVLLLECVKELDDAYTLMGLLEQHGIKLQQVRLSCGCGKCPWLTAFWQGHLHYCCCWRRWWWDAFVALMCDLSLQAFK